MDIVYREGFTVMGRSARTSNALEMAGKGVIGEFWSKWNPELGQPVAVYCDYDSDKNGEYRFLLGVKAGENDTLAVEFAQRFVEAGNYVCLKSEGTASAQIVMDLWKQVWTLEDAGGLVRRYATDFESYSAEGVALYVGVKS